MKNKTKGLWFLICMVCVFFLPLQPIRADQGGFRTKSFQTDILVKENHEYEITETITVDFTMERHGLYRYIPYDGTFYREINQERVYSPYHAEISILNVEGGPYSVENDNGNKIIRIGDPNAYVIGEKTYVITYTWDPGDDGLEEFDDMYFNLMPTQWPTDIEEVAFRVTMPQPIDPDQLHFYLGHYGEADATGVEYTVDGNTVVGYIPDGLYQDSTITINLRLPEGYYKGARPIPNGLPMALSAGGIGLIAVLLLSLLLGRRRTLLSPVMFYPPNNFDSALVGTIIDGTADTADMVSLIIYLAAHGFLAIEETTAGKRLKRPSFTFYKLQDLPPETPDHVRTIFEGLFPNGRSETSDAVLEGNFYEYVTKAKSKTEKFFDQPQTRLFTGASQAARIISVVLAVLVGMAVAYALSVEFLLYFDFAICALFFLFYCGLSMAICLKIVSYLNHWNSIKKSTRRLKMVVMSILLILYVVTASVFAIKFIEISALIVLPILAIPIMIIRGMRIYQYTDQGHRWLDEIMGFRHFIEVAELDRLTMLVDENPNYFYDILPYAYVMGLTTKWAKNFEGLTIPPVTWYRTDRELDWYSTTAVYTAFENSMASMGSTVGMSPPRSGSGGDSDSYGGGGGFAGGGGGGGGGGSW